MNELFTAGLGLACALVIWWGGRTLPGEKWQIMAAVPRAKDGGQWLGMNLTYYGAFSASAYVLGVALLIVMMTSLGNSLLAVAAFGVPLLSVCLPASRLVARWVEHKPQTFTVGGASFVGLLLGPWLVYLARKGLGPVEGAALQVLPCMAALTVAYAFGEGLGRLACLSFGCCYGKPLEEAPAFLQRLLAGRGQVFHGGTKKISYESGMEGRAVLPVQLMSAAICTAAGVAGLYLFLRGWWAASFLTALIVTQGWRAVAETLRADWRGTGRLSAYQIMALAGMAYGLVVCRVAGASTAAAPNLALGLAALWSPGVLLALQGLWIGIMLITGRSRTTASTIDFHVVRSQI